MKYPCRLLLFAASSCIWTLLALTGFAADPTLSSLTPDRFAALHALLKPQAEESKWLQIPWLADLSEARRRASAEGKPILLWEMDGHPLGCT